MQRSNQDSVWRQCGSRFPWIGIAGHVFDLHELGFSRLPHFAITLLMPRDGEAHPGSFGVGTTRDVLGAWGVETRSSE